MTKQSYSLFIIALIKYTLLGTSDNNQKRFSILQKKKINFRLYLGDVTLQDVNLGYLQRHLGAAKDS